MVIGLTSGTWDLLHESHLHFLERCSVECDKLIVGVDSNELVSELKGEDRPIFDERYRLDLINALRCVDSAFILSRLKMLTRIAREHRVSKVFKCGRFQGSGVQIYGTEEADLVTIPDVDGMPSTSSIIHEIRTGKLPIFMRTDDEVIRPEDEERS